MNTWSTDMFSNPEGLPSHIHDGISRTAGNPAVLVQQFPSNLLAKTGNTIPAGAEEEEPLSANQYGQIDHSGSLYANHSLSPGQAPSWYAAPQQAGTAGTVHWANNGHSGAYSHTSTGSTVPQPLRAQHGSLSPEKQRSGLVPAWQQPQQQQLAASAVQPAHAMPAMPSMPASACSKPHLAAGIDVYERVSFGQSMPLQQQILAGRLQHEQNSSLHVEMLSRGSSGSTLQAAAVPDVTSPPDTPTSAASVGALQQPWHVAQQQQQQQYQHSGQSNTLPCLQQPYEHAVGQNTRGTASPLRLMTPGEGAFVANAGYLHSLQQHPQHSVPPMAAVPVQARQEVVCAAGAQIHAPPLPENSSIAAAQQGVLSAPASFHEAAYVHDRSLMTAGGEATQRRAVTQNQQSYLTGFAPDAQPVKEMAQHGHALSFDSRNMRNSNWNEATAPAEAAASPHGTTYPAGHLPQQRQGDSGPPGVHAAAVRNDEMSHAAALSVHTSYRGSLNVDVNMMRMANTGPNHGYQQHMSEAVHTYSPGVPQWHHASMHTITHRQAQLDAARDDRLQQLQLQQMDDQRRITAAHAGPGQQMAAVDGRQAAPSAVQHEVFAQHPFVHVPSPAMYWHGMYTPTAAGGVAASYLQPAMVPMMIPAMLAPAASSYALHPANMVTSPVTMPATGQGRTGWYNSRAVPATAAADAHAAGWFPQPIPAEFAAVTTECSAGSAATAATRIPAIFGNVHQGPAARAAGTVAECVFAIGSTTAAAAHSSFLAVLWCGHLQLVLVLYMFLGLTASALAAQKAVWDTGALTLYLAAQLTGLTRRELWLFVAAATRVIMSDLCQLPRQLLDQPWLQVQQQKTSADTKLMPQSLTGKESAETVGVWGSFKALMLPVPSVDSKPDGEQGPASKFAESAAADASDNVSSGTSRQLSRKESQSWAEYVSAAVGGFGIRKGNGMQVPHDAGVMTTVTDAGGDSKGLHMVEGTVPSAAAHDDHLSAAVLYNSLTNNMLILLDSASVISGMWVGLGLKLWGLAAIRLPYETVRVWVSTVWGGMRMAVGMITATIPRVLRMIWCILHASLLVAVHARSHLHLPQGAVERAVPVIRTAAVKCQQALSVLFEFVLGPVLAVAWSKAAAAADTVPGGLAALQLLQLFGSFVYAAVYGMLQCAVSVVHSLLTIEKSTVNDLRFESIVLRSLGMIFSTTAWFVMQCMAVAEQVVILVASKVLQGAPPLAQTAVWGSAGMLKRMSVEVVQQTWLLMGQMYHAWTLQQEQQQQHNCTAQ